VEEGNLSMDVAANKNGEDEELLVDGFQPSGVEVHNDTKVKEPAEEAVQEDHRQPLLLLTAGAGEDNEQKYDEKEK